MEKSHVGLGFTICPICGHKNEADCVLLDKRLHNTLDRENFMGWEMCKEHQSKFDEGYITLVEIDPAQSKQPFQPNTIWRTGMIVHIKQEAFMKMFDVELPDNEWRCAYIDPEITQQLQQILGKL